MRKFALAVITTLGMSAIVSEVTKHQNVSQPQNAETFESKVFHTLVVPKDGTIVEFQPKRITKNIPLDTIHIKNNLNICKNTMQISALKLYK